MAATTKEKENKLIVNIPEIEFKAVRIKIKGTTPLVTNPFSLKQMQQISDKQHDLNPPKTRKHPVRNEWEDFTQALYWLSPPPLEYTEEAFIEAAKNGRWGFSVGGLKNSAVAAAARRGIVKSMSSARGFFEIKGAEQDFLYKKSCIEIITPEPPFMRVDCLSTFNSGADMRYRPQFDEWRMEFDVRVDTSVLTVEQLLTWFRLGGFACGLGENRAEKCEGWGSYELDM